MTDPFLILHKVRGAPAFDIATQIECASCNSHDNLVDTCVECDGLGYWWIIPTSGHRAHPWWNIKLADMIFDMDYMKMAYDYNGWKDVSDAPPMPEGWPDHYPSKAAPSIDMSSVLSALVPKVEVDRRF